MFYVKTLLLFFFCYSDVTRLVRDGGGSFWAFRDSRDCVAVVLSHIRSVCIGVGGIVWGRPWTGRPKSSILLFAACVRVVCLAACNQYRPLFRASQMTSKFVSRTAKQNVVRNLKLSWIIHVWSHVWVAIGDLNCKFCWYHSFYSVFGIVRILSLFFLKVGLTKVSD